MSSGVVSDRIRLVLVGIGRLAIEKEGRLKGLLGVVVPLPIGVFVPVPPTLAPAVNSDVSVLPPRLVELPARLLLAVISGVEDVAARSVLDPKYPLPLLDTSIPKEAKPMVLPL